MNLRDMYERDRTERLGNLAPRRDADKVSEADIWNGARDAKDAARVRQHHIDDLNTFTRKKHGRAATEAEITAYLNDGRVA